MFVAQVRPSLLFPSIALALALPTLALAVEERGQTLPLRLTSDADSGCAAARVSEEMRTAPPRVLWSDGRHLDEPRLVGARRRASGEEAALFGAPGVLEHLDGSFRELARTWGLEVRDDGARALRVNVETFHVVEEAESVGATYSATVSLRLTLEGEDARPLWKGRARGDASRFGRAGSREYANIVLSDALCETLSVILSQESLHDAWAAPRTTDPPSPRALRTIESPSPRETNKPTRAVDSAPAAAPDQVLSDLRTLLDGGFETEALVDFVRTKTLTRALEKEDVALWARAGLPRAVILAALECGVQESARR